MFVACQGRLGPSPGADLASSDSRGVRNGQRRVGAVKKLDSGEHQITLADVLKIVHLELARRVGLVPGLTGGVAVVHRRAILKVLTAAPRGQGRPEIVEHMPVETQPLARSEPDGPDPHPLAFGQELVAHAPVGMVSLLGEFLAEPLRPSGTLRTVGLFVQHCERHGGSSGEPGRENRCRVSVTVYRPRRRWQCRPAQALRGEASKWTRGSDAEALLLGARSAACSPRWRCAATGGTLRSSNARPSLPVGAPASWCSRSCAR